MSSTFLLHTLYSCFVLCPHRILLYSICLSAITDAANVHFLNNQPLVKIQNSGFKTCYNTRRFILRHKIYAIGPTSVTALSKAWVCGRSLAGLAGSNPAGVHGCLSFVSVVWCEVDQPDASASGWSLAQRTPTKCAVCLSVIVKPRKRGSPGSLGAVASWKN